MTAGEMNQSTLLTLDALAPCGCVLPTEVLAAMDVSLTLKARELGVKAFLFWGRLSTESGADYYIARAYNGTKKLEGKIVPNPGNKFYYSRDGVNWLDLEPVTVETTERAEKIRAMLTGDPAHVFEVAQPVPEPEPAPEPAEGEEAPEVEEPEPLPPWEITEAQYMMTRINAINAATALAPEGMFVTDPHGNHSVNPMFVVHRPDQASAYATPQGNLASAVPGKWGVHHDSFKRLTTIRNFEFPGFFAYYSAVSNTVGNLYFGDGRRNEDLAFAV
jgi:radial spoke head protein 9